MAGYRKLGKHTSLRKAILRKLVTDLFKYGKIETTLDRAKESGRIAEKIMTKGKKGDLHSRRQVLGYIYEKDVAHKIFDEIAPKYLERKGGYTRIYKLGPRRGDGAESAILELVEKDS